jgi:CxxC-x17-CxxC domain-containing protein
MANSSKRPAVPDGKTAVVSVDQDTRICIDCGAPFVFGDEERRFYTERGFKEPDRCLDCRASRRAERNADLIRSHEALAIGSHWVEALGHYGGGQTSQRNEGQRRSVTYPAVCAACGKETSVPFIPRHGRPVYCPSCYGARRRQST